MPSAKKAVCLNLGMQTVTAAAFTLTGDGQIVLTNFSRSEMLPDPSADASRPGQLRIALGELRSRANAAGAACAIAIPSQRIFTRLVKIPQVAPEQAGQMLFFEAQQNVPHPIEEVSWAYQVLPESDPGHLRAIIVATKFEDVQPSVESAQAAGFDPCLVEAAPTAIYNALRFSYPSLDGCSLVIDIGARTTNLIFADGERIFVRTLPIGGNAITTALQKNLEGQPLTLVEEFKVREAVIPPPGAHDDGSALAVEAGKTARTVMTRIHNEIARSIMHYRNNQNGSAPVRAFLAGGGASLPGAFEFFNEKLSIPVEFFNPLRRVSLAGTVEGDLVRKFAHTLGECTGLATRLLLGDCPLEIALQCPSLTARIRNRKRGPFLVAAVALLAAVLALGFLHFKSAANTFSEKISEQDQRIGNLQNYKSQLDEIEAGRRRLLADNADMVSAPFLRKAWPAILDELSSRMPPRSIWITQLRPMTDSETASQSGGEGSPSPADAEESDAKSGQLVTSITVDGLYLENEAGDGIVRQFVESLAASDVFRITAENKDKIVTNLVTPNDSSWAFEYRLVLPLRRPIQL